MNDESTPKGAHEIPAPASAPSVADGSDITAEWLDGYELGLIHGDPIGYQRAHDEWHARAEVSAAVARLVSQAGPYADAAERRGQPERAAAQRALLAERGI